MNKILATLMIAAVLSSTAAFAEDTPARIDGKRHEARRLQP